MKQNLYHILKFQCLPIISQYSELTFSQNKEKWGQQDCPVSKDGFTQAGGPDSFWDTQTCSLMGRHHTHIHICTHTTPHTRTEGGHKKGHTLLKQSTTVCFVHAE